MSARFEPDPAARFHRAVAQIDHCNRRDPTGRAHPHAVAVVARILELSADASEALRLAGRAAHIERWRIPRDNYPTGRRGYLSWRRDLQTFHADRVGHILRASGYPAPLVERVRALVRKQRLPGDAEAGTLEDALCLVFLDDQLADFQRRHDDAKLERILQRTWAKMTPAGRQVALGLDLAAQTRELLARSLNLEPPPGLPPQERPDP